MVQLLKPGGAVLFISSTTHTLSRKVPSVNGPLSPTTWLIKLHHPIAPPRGAFPTYTKSEIWDIRAAFFHWIPGGRPGPATSALDLQRKTVLFYRNTTHQASVTRKLARPIYNAETAQNLQKNKVGLLLQNKESLSGRGCSLEEFLWVQLHWKQRKMLIKKALKVKTLKVKPRAQIYVRKSRNIHVLCFCCLFLDSLYYERRPRDIRHPGG